MLKREDVYYIVVPIVTWVISLLCTYIFNNITGTKQWRLKREKSPGERYIEYFVRIIVIGALILFLNMLIEGFISSFIGTPLRVGEYIGVVIYIGLFVFLYIKMRKIDIDEDDKEIFIKKDMEECKRTRNVRLLRQIPIILSGLLWGYTITRHIGEAVPQFISNIARYVPIVTTLGGVVYDFICIIFLKGEGEFLYDKVKFVFYDNSVLENIKVENISQNKSWITAKNQENTEYRFRVKDIKTIEYSNTENQIECEKE